MTRDLFLLKGETPRERYPVAGLVRFAIKYALDYLLRARFGPYQDRKRLNMIASRIRIAAILPTSAVAGIGVSWAQGLVAFADPDVRGKSVIAGGVAATVLWLTVYFGLMRQRLDLEATCVILMSALVFGLAGAIVVRIWATWSLLPVFASCLGMLLVALSHFGRSANTHHTTGIGFRARIVEGACILVCSFVIGCGEGFLQGVIVFRDFRKEGFLGLSVAGDAGASVGGGCAALVDPLLRSVEEAHKSAHRYKSGCPHLGFRTGCCKSGQLVLSFCNACSSVDWISTFRNGTVNAPGVAFLGHPTQSSPSPPKTLRCHHRRAVSSPALPFAPLSPSGPTRCPSLQPSLRLPDSVYPP